ncbi:MAG: B12-binding domain-containing protein [Pseudomonadota bacterium]
MCAKSKRTGLENGVFSGSVKKAADAQAALPQEVLTRLASEALRRVAELGAVRVAPPEPEVVAAFCTELLASDTYAGARFVERAMEQGATLNDIYLGYMTEAARHLGRLWQRSEASLFDVSLATARMQAIVRVLSMQASAQLPLKGRAAVFVQVPDEPHVLGLKIATDLYRRAGWDIALLVGMDHGEILKRIQKMDVGLVGLSISGQHAAPSLSALVMAMRILRPELKIVVCGNLVAEDPMLAEIALPDATAATYEESVPVFEGFIAA